MTTRVGLLIPSSNTVMEPDFHRNLPPDVSVHTGRMYMETTTVEGEELMLDEHTIPTAQILATANPDMVVYGCTSAGALRGNDYDVELCRRLSEITGAPTISVIESVRHDLKATGGSTVAILTPYVDELNQRIVASVEGDGFQVVAMHGMGITHNFDIASVEPAQIVQFAKDKLGAKLAADILFVSCTNFRALSALSQLRELYGAPVVTSNQAALNAVGRQLSAEPATAKSGR
jgi:maleate isomerase